MLSPLDFSPHCYLHPAFLTYPNHLGPTTFAPMPVALLKECTTNDGFTARTALCSFPSHSLPFQAALLTHNPYSLQIPLDKSLLPSSFQLLTRFLQTNQTLQPGSQGLLYPPHLLLCLFSGSHGKIPWLCMHSNSCWLLSAPHYFCFPVWLPLSLNSPLPSAPFHLQLQLGPLCMDPATPLSNHQMPCLSVTADFSPLSAAHLQRPCPGSSHSLRSL